MGMIKYFFEDIGIFIKEKVMKDWVYLAFYGVETLAAIWLALTQNLEEIGIYSLILCPILIFLMFLPPYLPGKKKEKAHQFASQKLSWLIIFTAFVIYSLKIVLEAISMH